MTDHIDHKTASIDESFPVATAILFGADHQDTATPGPFEAHVIADAFDARESTLADKTLVTPQIAARRFVGDATSTTYHATVAGGGGNKVSLVSDGTNWLIS